MSVSSINDHIKPPKGAVFVRAGAREGWFVITFFVGQKEVELFYNQMGREVFRVDYPHRPARLWQRLIEALKGHYADPDSPKIV